MSPDRLPASAPSSERTTEGGQPVRPPVPIDTVDAPVGNAAMARALQTERPTPLGPVLNGLDQAGNHSVAGLVQRQTGDAGPTAGATAGSAVTDRVAFVREEGLNLRTGPDTQSAPLAQLTFGQRVHVLGGAPEPSWQRVAALGRTGFVAADRIHAPPDNLIQRDPALRLVRVKSRQTFWGLVKESYGIQGNEGGADQNINHFINAIRAVNDPAAFRVRTGVLDDVGNAIVPGRDASDTELIEGYDLWIPSYSVAAAMDVGSGTVTGEVARVVKKIQQKIDDLVAAGRAAGKHIPEALTRRCGEAAEGLLAGLVEFAKDAAKILAASTLVGALIGSLAGGVGAVPGAEIGFEIGLFILELYGLAMLIEAILAVAGSLLTQLGRFVELVWTANGDPKQIEEAGKTLADALGIMAAAILTVVAAYLMKEGAQALAKTRFAQRVGETELARWFAKRQKGTTTRETIEEAVKKRSETSNAITNLGTGGKAANLDDFPPGESAFSGVYDPASGKVLAYPSGNTTLIGGKVPDNLVPRRGGHAVVNRELCRLTGADPSRNLGFTAFLEKDGSLSVDWLSRSVNGNNRGFVGDFVPEPMRQPILDALAESTGRKVVSK